MTNDNGKCIPDLTLTRLCGIISAMKDQYRHIVQCFQEHLGEDNVTLAWKSSNMSDRCEIDIFYSVLQDGRGLSSNGIVTPSLEMSVEATAKTGKITEMYYGGPEYRARICEDDPIIHGSVNESKPSCPLLYSPPARDDKGYYAVKSAAAALLTEKYEMYEESFNALRPRFENPSDSLFGTCQMLFYMHDHLEPKQVLSWFQHDTPLIRQLRHSSPFYYVSSRVPKEEYDALIYDIVNHPEKYRPLPSHQIWLDSILDAGGIHINDFTRQFIPENRLPE